MVVFDEHPVVEAGPVVAGAAQAHGVFLQGPPARGGLAGVHQGRFGAGDQAHHLPGKGGDAGEALEEIEGGALAGEDGGHRPGEAGQHRARATSWPSSA